MKASDLTKAVTKENMKITFQDSCSESFSQRLPDVAPHPAHARLLSTRAASYTAWEMVGTEHCPKSFYQGIDVLPPLPVSLIEGRHLLLICHLPSICLSVKASGLLPKCSSEGIL